MVEELSTSEVSHHELCRQYPHNTLLNMVFLKLGSRTCCIGLGCTFCFPGVSAREARNFIINTRPAWRVVLLLFSIYCISTFFVAGFSLLVVAFFLGAPFLMVSDTQRLLSFSFSWSSGVTGCKRWDSNPHLHTSTRTAKWTCAGKIELQQLVNEYNTSNTCTCSAHVLTQRSATCGQEPVSPLILNLSTRLIWLLVMSEKPSSKSIHLGQVKSP